MNLSGSGLGRLRCQRWQVMDQLVLKILAKMLKLISREVISKKRERERETFPVDLVVWNLSWYLCLWVCILDVFLFSNIISMRTTRKVLWIFQKSRQLWQLQGFIYRHWHCTFQYISDSKVKICTYCSSAWNLKLRS